MQTVNPFYNSTRDKKNIDIIDYAFSDLPFENIYEKDSRIEKYHNATVRYYPELKNWTLSGHYITENNKNGGTKTNCGQVRGIKKSKFKSGKAKPIINSCGRLHCKVCYREASSIKAMNINDHLDSVLYYMLFENIRFTRSRVRNLDFKHFSLNPAPKYEKTRDWSHLLKYFENYDLYLEKLYNPVKKIVAKYFIGAVIVLHLYRFWDKERTILFFSPHFHVVGVGSLPESKNFKRRYKSFVKEGDQEWGINYWNMKNKITGLYLLSKKSDIVSVLKYVLSHAGLYMYDQKRKIRQSKLDKEANKPREYGVIKASKVSYNYVNLFSPQKFKIKKEFNYKVSLRDENNDLYYELIDGFVLKASSLNGLEKILLPSDLLFPNPVNFYINDDSEIFLDHDRLKFGARLKRKKRLKVLIIRNKI